MYNYVINGIVLFPKERNFSDPKRTGKVCNAYPRQNYTFEAGKQ